MPIAVGVDSESKVLAKPTTPISLPNRATEASPSTSTLLVPSKKHSDSDDEDVAVTTNTPSPPPVPSHGMLLVYIALITAQVMWSCNHITLKYGEYYLNSFGFNLIRSVICVVAFGGMTWTWDKKGITAISCHDHWLLLVVSIIGNMIPQQIGQIAIGLADAAIAGMVTPITPVFTTALAVALQHERATFGKVIGIGFTVAGSVGMVLGSPPSTDSSGGGNNTLGITLFLIQSMCTAVQIVIQIPLLQRISVAAFMFWFTVYAAIGNICIGAYFLVTQDWSGMPWLLLPAVAYSIIGGSIVAYLIYSYAIKYLHASIAALALCLQSVCSPILGVTIYGETVTGWQILGALGIVAGIVVVVWARTREPVIAVSPPSAVVVAEEENGIDYVGLNDESIQYPHDEINTQHKQTVM